MLSFLALSVQVSATCYPKPPGGCGTRNYSSCVDTANDCGSLLYDACSIDGYQARGGGCAKSCPTKFPTLKDGDYKQSGCCDNEWVDCDGKTTVTPAPTLPPVSYTLSDGSVITASCQPKPDLADSFLAAQAVNCIKYVNDKASCTAYQQYCDWKYNIPASSAEYKYIKEEDLFGDSYVLDALYSSKHGLFPPVEINGMNYGIDKDGVVREPRKSRWVMWHHDVMTEPEFIHLGCDCLEGNAEHPISEDPKGWFLTSDCNVLCNRSWAGSDNKIYSLYTVHDRVCHREVDTDGVRWDPSPNMNFITPLSKLFPTRLGPEGLDMKRGEGGASWYWWGGSKPSWNSNDQTSNVHVGELTFETEAECKNYAKTYWDIEDYEAKILSVCSQFSSKTPCATADGQNSVTNFHCQSVCEGTNGHDEFLSSRGVNDYQSAVTWFHDNCVYTPYQPENDHAWPNFYVPEVNQCFSQWQIGYEDQGCDQCVHPLYDNTPDFNDGWSYGPVEGSSIAADPQGKGNCSAQCGKIIMDGPGKPKDVKTAQECQQYCQMDSNCVHFQWRPTSDWALAAEDVAMGQGNHFNQVRSCLLKNKFQFEGALAARWDETGNWLYHPENDHAAYANIYQNNDCAQSNSGDGYNWCLACEEPVEGTSDKQILYHAFKWRNNMISGPKFCDTPKLVHGNTDREPSKFWDSEAAPLTVPTCPNYPGIGTLVGNKSYTVRYNNDGSRTEADQGCFAKEGMDTLFGGSEWAEHCVSANRRMSEDACDRFQQYCDWIVEYRLTFKEYKRFTDEELFGAPQQIQQNKYSSTFGVYPPVNGTTNNLPPRSEKWVFWHYDKLSVQYPLTCDCLEPACDDSRCALIANSADVTGLYTLHDKVCHRESDVNAVRFDPSPLPSLAGLWEAEWQTGLGMAAGEAGSSWFWYGASKPSWNVNDQTSHVKVGEVLFDNEVDCREYATSYWKDLGFPLFLSVCEMFSSKTISVSNDQCRAACDNTSVDAASLTWFKDNCVYTPYQGESDHVWPNVYVPESNTCFAQWQIGYEDQGCDHCIHDLYDNTADFRGGWQYHPVEGSSLPVSPYTCSAQCGKFIMDGPGKPRDVKTAQECQFYCQEDPDCAAFQWRFTPDYTAAASLFSLPDGTTEILNNNKYNKVRVCALKSTEQVLGALNSRWTSDGKFYGNSDPSWSPGMDDTKEYNQFAQGEWAINDSQNSQRSGEGNNWYIECVSEGDAVPTTHSWKWRNNFVSGPKYCDDAHTLRVQHGKKRPSSSSHTADSSFVVPACPAESTVSYAGALPISSVTTQSAEFPDWSGVPDYIGITTTTSSTSTKGFVACCDLSSYDVCSNNAYDSACTGNTVPGCAKTCSINVAWKGLTCDQWAAQFVKAKGEQWNVSQCSSVAPTPPSVPSLEYPHNNNGWDGVVGSCANTTSSSTSTTTAPPVWDLTYTPGHPGLPPGIKSPYTSSPKNNGYVAKYTIARDGISGPPGSQVNITSNLVLKNCVNGDSVLFSGKYSKQDYWYAKGVQKLVCAGYSPEQHAKKIFSNRNCTPNNTEIFGWANLAKAAGAFPDFMGSNDLDTNRFDLASFLAHTSAETRGSSGVGGGYCFATETVPQFYGTTTSNSCGFNYTTSETFNNDAYPTHYIGRGAIQVTWCTNYDNVSTHLVSLGEDPANVDFQKSPSKLLKDWYAFGSGLVFFMSPEVTNSKPSMHNVSTYWSGSEYANLPIDNLGRIADFGMQINILNGGLECNGGSHSSPPVRMTFMHNFLDTLGYDGNRDFVNIGGGCKAPDFRNAFEFLYFPDTHAITPADTARY